MEMSKRDTVFSQVQTYAREFDRLMTEVKKKRDGEVPLEPAITLDRLLKNASAMRELMQQELSSLRKHNDQMERTTCLLREMVKYKSVNLGEVKEKIKDYTVNEKNEAPETTDTKPNKQLNTKSRREEKNVAPSGEKERHKSGEKTGHKTPLKTLHNNITGTNSGEGGSQENVQDDQQADLGQYSTPRRVAPPVQQTDEVMKTPKLADYLSLDDMYEILDATNLVTKSSKKSSMKKAKSTPNLFQSAKKSASKSRKALLLEGTPGKSHLLTDDTLMLTPVMPQLTGVERPKFLTLPKLDFTGRIAMVDVIEFHSKVDDYVKGLVTLDLLNKVINRVDLMFQMEPTQPMEREALNAVVTPLAGAKAKLCMQLLIHLNRVQPVRGGKDLMRAVLGKPDN